MKMKQLNKTNNIIIDTDSMQMFDIPLSQNKQETTMMGDPSFPLAVFHTDLKRNVLGYVNWHWNRELQFCIVVENTVIFKTDGKEYEISAGDGIFINAGVLHMSKPVQGQNGVYICVMADTKLFHTFKESVFERKYFETFFSCPILECVTFFKDIKWQSEILDKIKNISNSCYNKLYGFELEILSDLMKIWQLMIQNINIKEHRKKKQSRDNQVVNSILKYIGENYSRRIRIEDISKAVYCSPSECCRIFKKVLGETISQYLTGYRIEHSTELLNNTSLSVNEIAYETGFCSASYYVQNFRNLTGKTPLRYRSENNRN